MEGCRFDRHPDASGLGSVSLAYLPGSTGRIHAMTDHFYVPCFLTKE
jgi:hypothetical protein